MNKRDKKEPMSVGSALLVEQPFVYVLQSKLSSERCDNCFKKTNLLTCRGCNLSRYCDQSCQKKGWYFHKRECKNFKRIAPRILPDAARLLARIIFKLEKGGASQQGFYTRGQFRVFMDLMSHYNEIRNDEKRMEHFQTLFAVLEVFFGDATLPNPVELLRIYGKMVVNTFCILDGEMQSIGTGMYLAGSIVDHSCEPNAVAVFEGITLNIRTLIDIPNLDWNKVFISYVDLLRYPEERQKDLKDTYYFLCQCKRCLDPEELNLMKATICSNDTCRLRIPGGEMDKQIKCLECNETISEERRKDIDTASEFTDQQLMKMKDVAYIDICRFCLKKLDGLLDPMNLRYVRVLDMAFESSIELALWEDAIGYGKRLILPFQRYCGMKHPLTGILFFKLGKIALVLDMVEEAKNWLKEAAQILLVTHGKTHSLIKEQLMSNMLPLFR